MKKGCEFGKSYEFSISFGMIFRKMHCCKCGRKLKIKYITVGYDPNKKWRKHAFLDGNSLSFEFRYLPKGVEYLEPVYHCKTCNYNISYETQKYIRKYQEAGRRYILTENEIDSYNLIPKDKNIDNT